MDQPTLEYLFKLAVGIVGFFAAMWIRRVQVEADKNRDDMARMREELMAQYTRKDDIRADQREMKEMIKDVADKVDRLIERLANARGSGNV